MQHHAPQNLKGEEREIVNILLLLITALLLITIINKQISPWDRVQEYYQLFLDPVLVFIIDIYYYVYRDNSVYHINTLC